MFTLTLIFVTRVRLPSFLENWKIEVFWLIYCKYQQLFSYRNIIQNGTHGKSKLDDAFLSKSSKSYLVQIIWHCSNFTSMWNKCSLIKDFRLLMSAFAMTNIKNLSKYQLFTVNFAFTLFMFSLFLLTVEVQNSNCDSQITMFATSSRNSNIVGWSKLNKIWAFWQKPVTMLTILTYS